MLIYGCDYREIMVYSRDIIILAKAPGMCQVSYKSAGDIYFCLKSGMIKEEYN